MQYVRLRIIILNRKKLDDHMTCSCRNTHIILCRHAQINTDPLWCHKQLKDKMHNKIDTVITTDISNSNM